MTEPQKQKATKRLSNISFSEEGAAVSLVGPVVGGAANKRKTLIMKSLVEVQPQDVPEVLSEEPIVLQEEVVVAKAPAKKSKSKGEPMTQEVEDNKSELVQVQKALDEQKVELQKALDLITKFKEAEVQAVVKAKTAKVEAVVKNKEYQAIIAKACLELKSEDDFDAFLAAIQTMQAGVTSSEMFVEKGLQSSVDKPSATPADKVMAVVKARIAAGK